jgi:hypothetical protein
MSFEHMIYKNATYDYGCKFVQLKFV